MDRMCIIYISIYDGEDKRMEIYCGDAIGKGYFTQETNRNYNIKVDSFKFAVRVGGEETDPKWCLILSY